MADSHPITECARTLEVQPDEESTLAAAAPRERPIRPDWRPNSPQARALAGSLRRERLTVLRDDDRASMTALLTAGVLPLLGRRAADATQQADEAAPTVLNFPERRQRADWATTEVLVLFDAGTERTVDLLKSRFEASARAAGFPPIGVGRCLADHVDALAAIQKTLFLFIIVGFDTLVPLTGVAGPAQRALVDELVDLLNRPSAANVLLASTPAHWAGATSFVARLRGVDPVVVSLTAGPLGGGPPPPTLTLEVLPPVRPPVPTPMPGVERRSAAAEAFERGTAGWPAAGDTSWPTSDPFAEPFSAPLALPGRQEPPRGGLFARHTVAFFGAVLLAFAAWVVWWQYPRAAVPTLASTPVAPKAGVDGRLAAAPPAAVSPKPPQPTEPVQPAGPPPTALALHVDGEDRLPRRMVEELARTLGEPNAFRVEPQIVPNLAARLAGTAPALAVASYDDLKAAAGGGSPVTVVAPLGTETIQVWVRSDSTLHYLHELQGKRLAVGPAGASRALTAGLLYRKMFGAPLPAAQAVASTGPEAIERLLHDGSLDAVLLLGAQADTLVAALPEAERRALRPLTMQPDRDATRRAMQDYLPVRWTDASGAQVLGLASMSFLVGTGGDDSAGRSLDRIAATLCAHLGQLQREGDPGWRGVQAGWRPPIALAHVDTRVIDSTWASCQANDPTRSSHLNVTVK